MSKRNNTRNGCKDVFRAFLVENATYSGEQEIPCLKKETAVPEDLILFSKAISSRSFDSWICFYEDDINFERLWNNPQKYLPILKRFAGVISPDFSLYRDMPLVMQEWNVYRNRAIAHWLQENGIPVIPNIRWGDERTYELCCSGIQKGGTIAIGSHGCIKLLQEREPFKSGLDYVINHICPDTIVVYGKAPDIIFDKYRKKGITIRQFESDFSITHRKAVSR
jgi:hypothetical protein